MRRMLAAVLALATLVALAGCASIPRSGPVEQGGTVASQDNGFGPVDYLPSGPEKGASQKEILRGFIDAAVSPQGGYAVAQEFLTAKFGASWNPDASVTIDTGTDRTYTSVDANHLLLGVTPTAYVDADGNYRRSDSSTPLVQPYSFEKVGNEWRISKAPDGVVIDAPRFTDVFSAHPIYFYSPDYRYLVPDERWFPSLASTQTRIVKSILVGPAKWLSGAVVSAFPQGAQLTVQSIPVSSDGDAVVPLNGAVSNVGMLTLQRMKLQLVDSLASVASISSVSITADGVQRPAADLGANAPLQNPVVDADPLVLKGDKFGFLSGSSVTVVPGISDKVQALAPTAVTLSADRATAAVLAASGVYAVRAGADAAKPVDSRPNLIAPSLDGDGFVWSVPADQPNAVQVSNADGASSSVAVAWPGATAIRSLAVSRDGTRVAALIQSGNRQSIVAAGIVRSTDNRPDHLTEPVDFGTADGTAARSLTWIDELTVGLITSDAQGGSSVSTQVLGGELTQSSAPATAATLAGGNGSPLFWVLTSAGSLEGPRGTGWQQKSDSVTLLATQLGRPE